MAKIESLPGKDWSPAAALANLLEDSDDIRNTPARPVVSLLKSRNAEVRIHDPYIAFHAE